MDKKELEARAQIKLNELFDNLIGIEFKMGRLRELQSIAVDQGLRMTFKVKVEDIK